MKIVAAQLRRLGFVWMAAAMLPLPALLVSDPNSSAEIGCLYLAVGSAWLATQIILSGGLPDSLSRWSAKMLAVALALSVNCGLVISLGTAVNVKSNFGFPQMAVLSVIPAMGLVPWLTLRMRDPHAAVFVAAFIALGAKLAGCVVARIVYGPDFQARGYIAGDWRTAKLMISTFWALTALISIAALASDAFRFSGRLPQLLPEA